MQRPNGHCSSDVQRHAPPAQSWPPPQSVLWRQETGAGVNASASPTAVGVHKPSMQVPNGQSAETLHSWSSSCESSKIGGRPD